VELDLSFDIVELKCPGCSYAIEVLLKQIMVEETILCPGCYAEIQLVDEGSFARQVQAEIREALAALERASKRFER
jgi:peptide subunit release factor 1 (eRF1)